MWFSITQNLYKLMSINQTNNICFLILLFLSRGNKSSLYWQAESPVVMGKQVFFFFTQKTFMKKKPGKFTKLLSNLLHSPESGEAGREKKF